MAHLDSLIGLLFMMLPPFDPNKTTDPAGNRPDKGKGILGAPFTLEGAGSGSGSVGGSVGVTVGVSVSDSDSGSGSGGGAKDKGKGIAMDDGTEQKGNYYGRMDIEDFDLHDYDDDDDDYDYDYGFMEDFGDVDAKKKDKAVQGSQPQTPP